MRALDECKEARTSARVVPTIYAGLSHYQKGVGLLVFGVGFPSTSKKAHRALVRARPTPIHIARWKLSTNAAAIACCIAACSVPWAAAGTCAPASLFLWASSNCRTPGETCNAFRRLSRLLLKACRTKMLSTAMASRPATRATALLIPEAIPA